MAQRYKILFLCTGNSARSIMGEYLIRQMAPDRFESFSAGANPTGKVNPLVQKCLQEKFKIDTSDARSKSWTEFKETPLDFVITVCDNAKESCPIWPGQPILAHWGSPDPAEFQGTEEEILHKIYTVALQIRRRIELFCSLPLEKTDRIKLQQNINRIADNTIS